MPQVQADAIADRLSSDHDVTAEEVHELELELRASVSVAERLGTALHPWTSYVVIPTFALANAGIPLTPDSISDAVSSRVTLRLLLGLVVGQLIQISAITWLGVRLCVGRLPSGVARHHVLGQARDAGTGFTSL